MLKHRLPDPFLEACGLADSPGGLLGKVPPAAIGRVENYIGKPLDRWTVHEWQRAAEILGYFADELERRQREADEARRLAAAPKRRTAKRKKLFLPRGLLYVMPARGRPRKLTEVEERKTLELFEGWNTSEGRRLGRILTDKKAAEIAWWAILTDKERGKPLSVAKRRAEAFRKAKAFAKDVSRWRTKYRAPLKPRKARPK